MAETSYLVKVNLYDMTQGMARQLSPGILGREISGFWHTGIVVYGKEYFWADTVVNMPERPQGHWAVPLTQSLELGRTELPQEMFEMWLAEVAPRFQQSTYDLISNNCNHFTEEAAQFLVGTSIPSFVLTQAEDVFSTPLGAAFRPMVENLNNQFRQAQRNMQATQPLAAPGQAISPFVALLGTTLLRGNTPVPTDEALAGKQRVGIYFSAHWCPPCRGYTPLLAEKYEELVGGGTPLEIVFASSDRDEPSFREYFASMPWLALPFDFGAQQRLSQQFGVRGIPSLVILDAGAGTVTLDGRRAIMERPYPWGGSLSALASTQPAKPASAAATRPVEPAAAVPAGPATAATSGAAAFAGGAATNAAGQNPQAAATAAPPAAATLSTGASQGGGQQALSTGTSQGGGQQAALRRVSRDAAAMVSTQGNPQPMLNKLKATSAELPAGASMSESEQQVMDTDALPVLSLLVRADWPPSTLDTAAAKRVAGVLCRLIGRWPAAKQFPLLYLGRLLVRLPACLEVFGAEGTVPVLLSGPLADSGLPKPFQLMRLTILSNMLASAAGTELVLSAAADEAVEVAMACMRADDDQLRVTAAALIYNLSLQTTDLEDDPTLQLFCALVEALPQQSHEESMRRMMLAFAHFLLRCGQTAAELATQLGFTLEGSIASKVDHDLVQDINALLTKLDLEEKEDADDENLYD